jgi:hypothetical protein
MDADLFKHEFLQIFEEAFETHHGIFLDRNNSLFTTLAGISAAQASIPVGGKCATLGAQVAHVIFYLDVIEAYVEDRDIGKVDWGEIWRRVGAVSEAEWAGYQETLRTAYHRIRALFENVQDWDSDRPVGAAFAAVVHTAYHLGEIRQAMCTLIP